MSKVIRVLNTLEVQLRPQIGSRLSQGFPMISNSNIISMYTRWFRWFLDFKVSRNCVKATVSGVVEDLRGLLEGSHPNWLSQLNWDSQHGRLSTTLILVWAFWNCKFKVLNYSRNCSLHATLIPNLAKPLMCLHVLIHRELFSMTYHTDFNVKLLFISKKIHK